MAMANHNVTSIDGVGKKKAQALAQEGVHTVGQLADLEPGECNVSNLSNLIDRARKYLKAADANESDIDKPVDIGLDDTPQLIVGGLSNTAFRTKLKRSATPPHVESEAKIETKVTATADSKMKTPLQYLISSHTWFASPILIPRLKEGSLNEQQLKTGVIWEMSIEPENRISFVCTWTKKTGDKEKVCNMSYSPQMLYHFNLDLPALEINIREEDYDALPNKEVLNNVLWETNMMIHYAQK